MAENINPTGPVPKSAMIIGDDGIPTAIMDLDVVTQSAIQLTYDMASNSSDQEALAEISTRCLDEVGVDLFGYVTAAALKMMTSYVLEPTLEVCDGVGVDLRQSLSDAAANARKTL